MSQKAVFIAATGQNVGKTTICLGLISGLKKRLSSVGFMKPVGQEHVELNEGGRADKDVVLFKNHFGLTSSFFSMSPVLFPRGFTRDYLDKKVEHDLLTSSILDSFKKIQSDHSFTVVEGTGHTGVGSIVNLNNAQVAKLLGLDLILVVSGGLGSSFDELALNKVQCDQYGVKIAGIIINRVISEKRDMVLEYMKKALARWNIPILGCIPYNEFLSTPAMEDFEDLFQTSLISGSEHRLRHFEKVRLVATSVETYRNLIDYNQLVITPASREDIILATLTKYWDMKIKNPDDELGAGMILTGSSKAPHPSIVEQIKRANIPMLYAPLSSYIAMKMITSYTAKIHERDLAKVRRAIHVVESHIDFDSLLDLISL